MKRMLRRDAWRDGWWIQPELPTPVNTPRGRFPASVRSMPIHRGDLQFRYVSWLFFLTAYLVCRYVIAWYMATATFSITQGVPLGLEPFRLTPAAVHHLQRGLAVRDYEGRALIDPLRDNVLVVEASSEGTVVSGGDPRTIESFLTDACRPGPGGGGILVIAPKESVSYGQVVATLDAIGGEQDVDCDVRVILASVKDREYGRNARVF